MPGGPGAAGSYAETVTFDVPLKADGFSIVQFLQRKSMVDGKPTGYGWAFQVTDWPNEMAGELEGRYRTKFVKRWAADRWDVDASEAGDANGPVSRNLSISAYSDPVRRATVTCDVDAKSVGNFKLPAAAELFGVPEQVLPQLNGADALPFATPATAKTDRIIDALLPCSTDFFEVLREEKSAFPPAQITRRYRITVFDVFKSMADVAEFQQPIESRGLHFESYL